MGVASLYLDCPPPGTDTCGGDAEERLQWMQRLESLLRNVLLAKSNRLETRMWLCAALAELRVPFRVQFGCFKDLMVQQPLQGGSSSSSSSDAQDAKIVREALVRLMCENRPAWVAEVVFADGNLVRRFFLESPKRILQWFQHFGMGDQTDQKRGARALARFAFMHRDSCWEELEWIGTHGQAPATVASKPHYFLELDVLQTVHNFLKNVPSFWSSEELWDSLKDGEFISLDKEFFSHELLNKMLDKKPSQVQELLNQYLEDESFSLLCHRILHVISDAGLLSFINGLAQQSSAFNTQRKQGYQSRESEEISQKNTKVQLNWLEEVINSGSVCTFLEDAILCTACVCHNRQILHLLHEEDYEEDAVMLKHLVSETDEKEKTKDENEHWALRKASLGTSKWTIVKRLALEAWFLFARLSENRLDNSSFEQMFLQNSIGFRHLDEDKRYFSDTEKHSSTSRAGKRKQRKQERKKRKKRDCYYDPWDSQGEIADETDLNHAMKSSFSGWRLSTDDYFSTFQKGDLADHLSGYAFCKWIQWAAERW